MNRIYLAAALAGALALSTTAAMAETQHMRGTLTAADGRNLTIATDSGETAKVTLNEDAPVFGVSATDAGAIQTGKFVGITSIERDGVRTAVEVHVFAEALRGVGEGHYPWSLPGAPNMMTNADVAKILVKGADRSLKVRYKTGKDKPMGEQTIAVPDGIPVVFIDNAKPEDLKAGAKVFLFAIPADDGGYTSPVIAVGLNGLTPPF